jgi:tRNA(Ile)-lysidine synthase
VKGLAGMAGEGALPGSRSVRLLRPLLAVPRERLARHARENRLDWVEDESNASRHHDRNYLRHDILPLLKARFPSCLATLGRTASHLAEAQALLDERAGEDARHAVAEGRLRVAVLAGFSAPRARNLLRHYLAGQGLPLPGERRLQAMLDQLTGARPDARLRIVHGGAELRRFAGQLYVVKAAAPGAGQTLVWHQEPLLDWLGQAVCFAPSEGRGISLEKAWGQPFSLRPRRGGERLRLAGNRPARSLKNLFQEAGTPPWERERLPLVYCGDTLVGVPGLGVDWHWRARPGEPGLVIEMGERCPSY